MTLCNEVTLAAMRSDPVPRWAELRDLVPPSSYKETVESTVRFLATKRRGSPRDAVVRLLQTELIQVAIWLEGWEACETRCSTCRKNPADPHRGTCDVCAMPMVP